MSFLPKKSTNGLAFIVTPLFRRGEEGEASMHNFTKLAECNLYHKTIPKIQIRIRSATGFAKLKSWNKTLKKNGTTLFR